MNEGGFHDLPHDESLLSSRCGSAEKIAVLQPQPPLCLDDFPEQSEVTGPQIQIALIEQLDRQVSVPGFMKALRKEQPDPTVDTGEHALIIPMKHPFRGVANDPEIIGCQVSLFRYFTILHRLGLRDPIHVEGQTPAFRNVMLNIGGTGMPLESDETQQLLFENPLLAESLLWQNDFPYFPFMTAKIRCIGMQSERTRAMHPEMSARYVPNLNAIVNMTRFTVGQLKILAETAEAFARFFQQMEDDFVETAKCHAKAYLPRLVVGYQHTPRLIKELNAAGITALIHEPEATPAARPQPSPTDSLRYRRAKEILAALRS